MKQAPPDRTLLRQFHLPAGVSVAEMGFGSGVLAAHHHPDPRICLVTRGTMHERRSCAGMVRRAGSATFLHAGEWHCEQFDESGASAMAIDFTPAWFAAHSGSATRMRTDFREMPAVSAIAWRLHRQLQRPDDYITLDIEGLALELTAELLRHERAERTAPGWLLDVRDRLHDEPARRVTIAKLAGQCGRPAPQLARSFRQHFGKSIAKYLRELRIEAAATLLRSGEMPISRIAIVTGFSDQSHLTRHFRRERGVTPDVFRALGR